MKIWEALVLGAIQGITEFLPVSSSGHLVLFQRIFKITEPALLFDTMVHVGTLAAVFAVLWRDIWDLLRRIIQPLTGYLALATVPTVILALIFKDTVERAFASGAFLGFAFLITAVFLTASEFLAKRSGAFRQKEQMNWLDALIIGLMQGIAIIPGVSRSGSTLSGALSRKLDRDFAARFSFLLSIPAILGALVLQIKDLAQGAGKSVGNAVAETVNTASEAIANTGAAGGIGALPIIVGTLTAAVVGFFSVKLMLKIVREKSLIGFAIYTTALGVLVLVDQFGTHIWF
jgi:undecaprenyl-diphosphatase